MCLESFRRFYPDSSVCVVSDGGFDYSRYCESIRAEYTFVSKVSSMGILAFTTQDAALVYLKRLWDSFPRMKETHVILLEDDVRVVRRHRVPFQFSVNGCNHNVRLPDPMVEALTSRGYTGPLFYGACGGCVLHKSFFENIPFSEVERVIAQTEMNEFYSDQLTSFIALYFGGTIGDYDDFYETFYGDVVPRLVADRVAFLHQYKYDYNVEPTPDQRALLGPYDASVPLMGPTGGP